jgi:hypothetical protein
VIPKLPLFAEHLDAMVLWNTIKFDFFPSFTRNDLGLQVENMLSNYIMVCTSQEMTK